jgi:hypothetical protein
MPSTKPVVTGGFKPGSIVSEEVTDVREKLLRSLVGALPFVEHGAFDAADRLVLRNARVRDAVQVLIEQLFFLLGREVAIVWYSHVVLVRDEIEDVLFEVGTGAANRMHLATANHLSQRQAELCRAHGACERDQHLAAAIEVLHIGIRRIDERRTVEMPIVMPDEIRDCAHRDTSGG